MAWSPGEHIEAVITQAKAFLRDVQIIRYDVSPSRAIIDLEGNWNEYRIIISEMHRQDRSVRYAYYALNDQNRLVHAFDNSPDNVAIKQKYELNWKSHIHAEVPHQHDSEGNLKLTALPITFETFVIWLTDNLQRQ